MVEVTQADREAAIKIFAMIFGNGHSATYALARSYRHFLFDELARHRIAALEEAAKVADEYAVFHDKHDDGLSGFGHMALGAREVADELRALKGQTDDPA